jgi:hypothetical protein
MIRVCFENDAATGTNYLERQGRSIRSTESMEGVTDDFEGLRRSLISLGDCVDRVCEV